MLMTRADGPESLFALMGTIFRAQRRTKLKVATAQLHDHGLLTKRDAVFGAWANVKVASP